MSEETSKHIHHALCGHGGERVIRDSQGNEICKVDGYEPSTKTVYQYHGCKWNGCTCPKNRTNTDENRYVETKGAEEWIKKPGYNVVSAWECLLKSNLYYILTTLCLMLKHCWKP